MRARLALAPSAIAFRMIHAPRQARFVIVVHGRERCAARHDKDASSPPAARATLTHTDALQTQRDTPRSYTTFPASWLLRVWVVSRRVWLLVEPAWVHSRPGDDQSRGCGRYTRVLHSTVHVQPRLHTVHCCARYAPSATRHARARRTGADTFAHYGCSFAPGGEDRWGRPW